MSELESSQGGHGVGGKLISCVVEFFGCLELMVLRTGTWFLFLFFSLSIPLAVVPFALTHFCFRFVSCCERWRLTWSFVTVMLGPLSERNNDRGA